MTVIFPSFGRRLIAWLFSVTGSCDWRFLELDLVPDLDRDLELLREVVFEGRELSVLVLYVFSLGAFGLDPDVVVRPDGLEVLVR